MEETDLTIELDLILDALKGIAKLVTLQEPYQDYWKELGHFIHIFTQAESRLLWLLRRVSGVSEPVSSVIFSGDRLDRFKDLLNGILDATGQTEKKNRLTEPLGHLKAINTVRNNLLHWGATSDDGLQFIVSNFALAPPPLRLREYQVDIVDFAKMRADLLKIIILLTIEGMQIEHHLPSVEMARSLPWQYKPPQPSPPRNQSPPIPQEPEPPQDASRELP